MAETSDGAGRERGGELASRADVELHVRVCEVALDGAQRDEQALGDLAVREAVGGELRDALFAGRECGAAAKRGAAGAGAGCEEFFACSAGESRGAAAVGEVESQS